MGALALVGGASAFHPPAPPLVETRRNSALAFELGTVTTEGLARSAAPLADPRVRTGPFTAPRPRRHRPSSAAPSAPSGASSRAPASDALAIRAAGGARPPDAAPRAALPTVPRRRPSRLPQRGAEPPRKRLK